jgi:hypothetical protein
VPNRCHYQNSATLAGCVFASAQTRSAEYTKSSSIKFAPPLGPLSALAISTTFLSKMARTNEEQQPKANSYHW